MPDPEPTDTDLEHIPDPEANSDTQYPTPDADTQDDTQDDTDERMKRLARELPGLGALVGVVREVLEERKDGEESEQPHLR